MKKTLTTVVLGALLAAGLVSCSTVYVSVEPEANAKWQGKSHAEIVQTYGAPNRVDEDGLGGKILVYEETRIVQSSVAQSTPAYGPYRPGLWGFYHQMSQPINTTVSTTAETETDYAHFFINEKGICYLVKTNLEKPKDKDDKNYKEIE